MATVNTSTITNTLPDPEFVTKSFRFILDRGIMGLGSGILKSRDGDQVAVVLPELHDDDNYSNEDLLKEMMSKFTPKRKNEFMMIPNHSSAVSANQPRGHFNIDFALAYNPSAPSLYIFDPPQIIDNWHQAVVFKTEPKDITTQIITFLNQHRLNKSTNLKTAGHGLKHQTSNGYAGVPHPWDDFRQTSIRIIVFLSSGSYDAINYQEV